MRISCRSMMGVKAGGILERGKYDPALLRSDLLAIRELFRRKGYLDATVGHEVLFDESKERVYLVVRILEGPLYGIERMTIQGAHIRSTDEVLAAMKSCEGGPYSQEQLDKDIEAIRSLYGRIGYIHADVHIARTFSEKEPKVTLTLTVTEGEKYYVNKVIIRGNLITQDHVIRRSVTILPGDLANTDELEETKRRLQNTGYFSVKGGAPGAEAVRVRFVDSTQPGKTDVLVEVVEGNMGEFSIGAGFSSTQGLIGTITLTHRNFDATGDSDELGADHARRSLRRRRAGAHRLGESRHDRRRLSSGLDEPRGLGLRLLRRVRPLSARIHLVGLLHGTARRRQRHRRPAVLQRPDGEPYAAVGMGDDQGPRSHGSGGRGQGG